MLLLCFSIYASPLARIYQMENPLLLDIERISLESGINGFSPASVVSGYELSQQMENIDRSSLSSESRQLYDSVMATLNDPFEGNLFGYQVDIAQEITVNTDPDTPYYDWVEDYTDRAPLLYGEVETIFGDHAYGIVSYALEKAFRESDFSGFATNNPLVFNGGNSAVQNSLPHTAFLALSGEYYTLVAGRDSIRYGRGNTGNLMLGDHVPYHDFIQAKLFNEKIRYSFLALPMNELVTQQMIDEGLYGQGLGEALYPHYNDPLLIPDAWHTFFLGNLYRMYISHRVEMDLFPWWRLAVTEGTLFYVDSLDLRMFSPLMLLHNLQNFGEVNNSMGAETEITLSSHWMIDVQYFFDQFQTAGEADTEDLIPPNANALLVGARYQYPLQDWYLKGFIEGVYTSPFAYLRTGDNTLNYGDADENSQYNLDFVHAVSMEEGKSGVNWLGYVYGPDSIVFAAGVEFSYRDIYALTSELRCIVQGEQSGLKVEGGNQQVVLQPAENINMLSPSGADPVFTVVAGLGGKVHLLKNSLTLYSRNYWIHSWDSSAVSNDFQMLFGARYTF